MPNILQMKEQQSLLDSFQDSNKLYYKYFKMQYWCSVTI